ncbi:MAG: hypothetical protein Q7R83_03730 [bacterium]|nr:hypothetical protein [bacterium]
MASLEQLSQTLPFPGEEECKLYLRDWEKGRTEASRLHFADEPLPLKDYWFLPFSPELWKAEARLVTDLQHAKDELDDVQADRLRALVRGIGSRLANSFTPANVEYAIVSKVMTGFREHLSALERSADRQDAEEQREVKKSLHEREVNFSRALAVINKSFDKATVRQALEEIEAEFLEVWERLERLSGSWEKFVDVYMQPDRYKKPPLLQREQEPFAHQSKERTIARCIELLTNLRIVRDTLIAQLLAN